MYACLRQMYECMVAREGFGTNMVKYSTKLTGRVKYTWSKKSKKLGSKTIINSLSTIINT